MFRLKIRATDDSVVTKRLSCAGLLKYLHHLKELLNAESNPFNRSSKQCRLLVEAMEKVAFWLSKWKTTTLSAEFLLDLLSLATKGVNLLEDCKQVTPSTWLAIAAIKTDSKEEFSEIFHRFLLALNGYVEVMQRLPPAYPPRLAANMQRCIHEVGCVIAALDKDIHFLSLQAAEDQRGLFESLERGHSFNDREQNKSVVARFLMDRLDDGQKHTIALRMDSPHITLGDPLGHGAYGVVYEATWMDRKIAVKQYSHQASLDVELRALLKTSHVNIMRVIGYTPEVGNKRSCLMMEQMAGDLGHFVHRLRKAELPLSVSVEILLQIASGMAHLHLKEIVHRDLKPENILFDRWPPLSAQDLLDGPGYFTAKIADFGVSRSDLFHTTSATAYCGTASYRAPEVLQEGNNSRARYSNKVDVYSFGMVCYKLLTRSDPCLSRNKALVRDFTDLTFPPHCPRAMVFFMRRCWARAQDRPSFNEICDFLSLFKSIVLNKVPAVTSIGPPVFQGISDDLLGKLVNFLGSEWLIEVAASLKIKPKFKEGTIRSDVDAVWVCQQVREHLDLSFGGHNFRWLCC